MSKFNPSWVVFYPLGKAVLKGLEKTGELIERLRPEEEEDEEQEEEEEEEEPDQEEWSTAMEDVHDPLLAAAAKHLEAALDRLREGGKTCAS